MTLRPLLLTLLVVPALVLATACGSDDGPAGAAATSITSQAVAGVSEAVTDDVIIIDVRTPEEFSQGHLTGAINHNVEDGSLEVALADLDPEGEYIVYCRSGRRSAAAAALMADKGFETVTDLGSLEDAAAATGLGVVTGP